MAHKHRKTPKKPKRPRTNASLAAWERHHARYKEWERKVAQIKSDKIEKRNFN